MSYNYIVTANRATAVSCCVTGNFTGPNDINLITAKLSRLEISKVMPDGLKFIKEVGVYGRIEIIKLFRPPGQDKDLLFILTNKYNVAVLECVAGPHPDNMNIITRKSGNIADPACRPTESGNIVIIDPLSRVVGLRLYDGLFKIIPLDKRTSELEAYNVRMEEVVVSDIAFLHGFQAPTIGFIYKDTGNGTSHIGTYELSLKERDFIQGPWHKEHVANEANIIIPVPEPFGGVLIIALESIIYINGENEKVHSLSRQTAINCYTKIAYNSYLLGDISGKLFIVNLEANEIRLDDKKLEVKNIKIDDVLNEISRPECLTYIDNSFVYVGSKLGDSQLIKLTKDFDDSKIMRFTQTLCETHTNLGPILDMCLVDLEKQGQGQLVTCSGHAKDGSIRIVRNGIGINEQATMPLDQIRGIWSLKIGPKQYKDNYLFLTFINDSYLWACEDDGDFDNVTEDNPNTGFSFRERTVLCANVAHNQILQVTRNSIRLIDGISTHLIEAFSPSKDIVHKACYNENFLVWVEVDTIYCCEIKPGSFKRIAEKKLESQIACIHLAEIEPDQRLLSVGFWFNKNIVIYRWPDLTELYRVELNTDISNIPRSIITTKLEDFHYLLISLGDGSVFYYKLDPKTWRLSNAKKVTLGTYETILKPFKSQSTTSIFACSDRPTVIYSINNKLVFSNVNLKEVNHMSPLDTCYYTDCLALVSDTDIIFGTIDEIQKLHIKTIPLSESPINIAYQQSTQTFGLISTRVDVADMNGLTPARASASTLARAGAEATAMNFSAKPMLSSSEPIEIERSNFLIIDQHTFEILFAYTFMPMEQTVSVLSARLGDGADEYFVVGTAIVTEDEPEAKQGRLIVFKWSQEANLQQVAELTIRGCPYSLCEFENNKFLAGINASVNLIELNSRQDLHIESTYVNATIALHLKRTGDLILMGDLMRSMSLYTYKQLQAHFEEIARDANPAWMTEVEIISEDTFLGAESNFNIFICKRDSTATNEQELQQVGAYHLGDAVNVMRQGTLVVQHPSESSLEIKRATIFGTVDGVVGLIFTIDETLFKKLELIQGSLTKKINSIGKIDHRDWRAFQANKSIKPAVGFVDGDLIEAFLDLTRDGMEQVAHDAGLPIEEVVRTIEELSRLH